MGNGMNKVLHGLYVGNFSDARDKTQLAENGITHILSIHDNARPVLADKTYMCIHADDRPDVQLLGYFCSTSEFIHKARMSGGTVLVHCLAGVSRSVTIATAYIMVATDLSWKDALNAVRGARRCANPNLGFQKQLQEWEHGYLHAFKASLYSMHPRMSAADDQAECKRLLEIHRLWVLNGDIDKESHPTYSLRHGAYSSTVEQDARGRAMRAQTARLASATVRGHCQSAAAATVSAQAAAEGCSSVSTNKSQPSRLSVERLAPNGCVNPTPASICVAPADETPHSDHHGKVSEASRPGTVTLSKLEEWDQ